MQKKVSVPAAEGVNVTILLSLGLSLPESATPWIVNVCGALPLLVTLRFNGCPTFAVSVFGWKEKSTTEMAGAAAPAEEAAGGAVVAAGAGVLGARVAV